MRVSDKELEEEINWAYEDAKKALLDLRDLRKAVREAVEKWDTRTNDGVDITRAIDRLRELVGEGK